MGGGRRQPPFERVRVPPILTKLVVDPYLECLVFNVSAYDHEIRVNDDALTGFDIPPADGWQYWMDPITVANLVEDTNTLRFVRDASTGDDLAISTVTVHWKEPAD